ncbi:aminotransferase class V-fold PLP-dependent enzyme [Clostridium estertheticum]|uniref:aminotransferase class V-fold PLP-dependent enzyme n=1 Tax=Clostridium estertheticum TaxID=238834 RepID=UPI001CF3C241|nr:aminotransferase class V-fold PLP-dependent enzyme [Clostridium estertheticum]MCB2305597.1 aminotransferase class V-fold PLP-dependent enzyme [Clostridium estertheticum]MCB2347883.1 aminotransferase class V-fold PLP-dependent enzyme [Clostridium estertheticum]MCB2348952.1 aminotransferase class V-fold PLP-dependent enzyme [Clostridium estertheticum]WAG46266.1 aminotransferase class V-fold PLP-dependent enzyme [Clostridium estertheticum]
MGFNTLAVHGGHVGDAQYGCLATPIYQTSTFIFDSAEQGGEAAVSTASGMGAISASLWTALKAGDHVVASDTLYGCTFSLLNHGLTRFGIDVTFVDATNLEDVKNALKPNTKVVYLETPANPTLKINDIRKISTLAHKNNKDCLLFVDNTFCTPYIQKPLELGADVVVHSATKYLNGHGDVIAGFAIGKKEFIDQVKMFGLKDMTGAVLSPFNAYLIIRGMKTLPIRMDRHCENAMKVAKFLESHPAVSKVYYPGLESFEYYNLAKSQMKLPGAMISFELKGGVAEGALVMNSLKLAALAVSLGDTETLIEHPASMTHSPYSPEERHAAGISDGLVRLSVGIENAEDIIDDLKQALDLIVK